MISTVKQADGTIGYADFSQVGDLGTVAVKVGDKYNEISAEAGSKVIGDSKQDDTVKGDNRIVIKINHATEPRALTRSSWSPTTSSARPTRTPSRLSSPSLADLRDLRRGQKAAQDAAGTAPLPSSLKSKITKSIRGHQDQVMTSARKGRVDWT
mgnify:CR=1 FL=1